MLGTNTSWTTKDEDETGSGKRRKKTGRRSSSPSTKATGASSSRRYRYRYEEGKGLPYQPVLRIRPSPSILHEASPSLSPLPLAIRGGSGGGNTGIVPSPSPPPRVRGGRRRRVYPPPTLPNVIVLVVIVSLLSILDICMSPITTTSAFRISASLSGRRRIVGCCSTTASVSIPAGSNSVASGSMAKAPASSSAGGFSTKASATIRAGAYSRLGHGGACLFATSTTAEGASAAGLDTIEGRRAWEDRVVQWCLFRIRECNKVPDDVASSWIDLVVDDEVLGKVRPDLAERLDEGPTFSIQTTTTGPAEKVITLSDAAGTTCEERTAAVGAEMSKLRDDGTVRGWRDELYPVSTGFGRDPVFLVERAAAPHLGVQQYGPHINGYVRDDDGKVRMWMGRRAADKSKYPGMLDHVAAGGQPHGIGPMDNVVKECHEEAGIPEELARRAVPAGAVTYEKLAGPDGGNQLDRNCLFCYDLELPSDFVPAPVDGEVEEFFLWDLDRVAGSLRPDFDDPIKPNCYLVVIDFLLRWGYISPESPGYLDVLRELRSGPCRCGDGLVRSETPAGSLAMNGKDRLRFPCT